MPVTSLKKSQKIRQSVTDRNKMKKRKFYKNCMLFMLLRAFTINSLLTFYSMPMLKMSHARVPSPKHDCHTFQLCQHLNRFAKLYSKICQAFHRSVLIQTVFFYVFQTFMLCYAFTSPLQHVIQVCEGFILECSQQKAR